jgi:hypothetical protein
VHKKIHHYDQRQLQPSNSTGLHPPGLHKPSISNAKFLQVPPSVIDLSPTNVTIRFDQSTMPKPLSGMVDVRRVDESHSNALTLYHTAGAPAYPNQTFLAALHKASETQVQSMPIDDEEGSTQWSITVEMPRFSVAVISVQLPK